MCYLDYNSDDMWLLKKVVLDHNHPCDPRHTRYMKDYRLVNVVDEMQMVIRDQVRITQSQMYLTFVVGQGGFE